MPPPALTAELPLNVLLRTVSVALPEISPSLKMPPPPKKPLLAELPAMPIVATASPSDVRKRLRPDRGAVPSINYSLDRKGKEPVSKLIRRKEKEIRLIATQ